MRYVRVALAGHGEEMEHGAIVPDVDWWGLPISRHISFNPDNTRRSCSKSRARARERGGRDIQNRNAREPAIKKTIHEAGISASDINDSGIRADTDVVQQAQRCLRIDLIPAQFVASFARVDSLPVGLGVHGSISRLYDLRHDDTSAITHFNCRHDGSGAAL